MSSAVPTTPVYEVIPGNALPLLDLSRSLGGEILRYLEAITPRLTTQVSTTPVFRQPSRLRRLLQDADAPLERQGFYRVAGLAFGLGMLLSAVACVVPKAVGVPCAVLGLAFVLPFCMVSFAFLRYDMLKLLNRTYDLWFYSLVNTFGAVVVAWSFADARACIAVVVWLGNAHTIHIDANTRFICYLNIVSIAVVALNLVVMLAIETRVIDGWLARSFRLRRSHEDYVATDNLISNALCTMTIIVLRNAYRRHQELLQQAKIGCPMLRCINYRCRVKIAVADATRLAELDAMTATERIYYAPDCSHTFPLSQMHYLRYQGVFDASQTFFPVQVQPLEWSVVQRVAFLGLGSVGLTCTAAAVGLYPSPWVRACAIVGLCSTMVFVGVTLGLYHRRAWRVIALSFDYVFISFQLSFGLWCTAMLFNWDARTIALASMWLWLHWVITVDALTPLMKRKIGVNIKLLVSGVLLLFVAAQLAVAVEVVWRDRWNLTDRVLVSVLGRVQVRLLPFFFSRLVLTFLWSLRVLWRVLTSAEGDAIMQLGRVAFRHTTTMTIGPEKPSPPSPTKPKGKAAIMSPAQVMPVTAIGPT